MSDDAMGLTQRELLMEMREDIKGLRTTVGAIAKDQYSAWAGRDAATLRGRERQTGRGERTRPRGT